MAIQLEKPVFHDPETIMTEAESPSGATKRGGWITLPFMLGSFAAITIAATGWYANLTVYLIEKFNVKSIDAAQIFSVVSGSINLFPVLGAILADSLLGSFLVIATSAFFSLLGVVLLTLSALFHSSTSSTLRFVLLYAGIALASIGAGGSRFTASTMGANQFDTPNDQNIFFNWFFVALYVSMAIGSTAIVYIEDDIGWTVGYGVCVGASVIGLAIFFAGIRFYRHDKPQGSPFTVLARVVVAAVRKRKAVLSSRSNDYYHDHHCGDNKDDSTVPAKSFSFINRAALVMEGDINCDGSIAKPWRVCSVKHVEDLKQLIRIFPLWSSSIFLATPIAIQSSLTILQALVMDRHLGKHFTIPAGSILVVVLISCSIFIPIFDRILSPTWKRLTGRSLSTLQRIGVGHVLNVLGILVSAVVESKRLKLANHVRIHQEQRNSIVSMSALWLFPQLILVGIGEAFHVPGQVALYYQEFPVSLRSTATAMLALVISVAFYLSTALIDFIRRITGWLPDNLNDGRLDYLYWVVVVIGVINFGYYLVCAKLYKGQNVEKVVNVGSMDHSDK